jgi:putative ABC transport system permease protein
MPDWKLEVRSLLAGLKLKPEDEERLVEELADHAEARCEELLARGVSEQDARRIVLSDLSADKLSAELRRLFPPAAPAVAAGSVEKENLLFGIARDLRLAGRQLRLNPLFALVAIVSLALGIGANAAIFQLIDAVILRTLPVPNPQQLANIDLIHFGRVGSSVARQHNFSSAMWEQIGRKQQAFAAAAAWSTEAFTLDDSGEASYAHGLWVSGGFFDMLQVTPEIGRLIAPHDDRPGCGVQGVVLSYGFWQRHFGGRPDIIGSRLSLDRQPFEIIGVSRAGFTGLEVGRSFDVALPLCSEPSLHAQAPWTLSPTTWWLDVMGRLAPGGSLQRASAELASISPGIFAATLPSVYDSTARRDYLRFTMRAAPAATGESPLRQEYEGPLWLLLGISGLVLLIACANLANLMLARASIRRREMALRLSLGASRARLVRQLVIESLLLALLGAAAGTGIALVLSRLLIHAIHSTDPSLFLSLPIDWRILGFAVGLGILSCLLFGVAPAVRASRADPSTVLRAAARGVTEGRERFRVRRGLIVSQMALSLLLVTTALLFVESFQNLMHADVGFQTQQIVVADFDLSALNTPVASRLAVKQTLLERVRAIPGVMGAAEAAIVPLSGNGWNDYIDVPATSVERVLSDFNSVTADYFQTLEIPILAGRTFASTDTISSLPVAIVNQAFAKKFLGPGDPVGRTFGQRQGAGLPDKVYHVVGLVGNTKENDLRERFGALVFVDRDQDAGPDLDATIVLRSAGPPASLLSALRAAAAAVSPAVVLQASVMRDDVVASLGRERLMAALSAFYGALAALLAAVGLYGIMSWMVVRRRSEIGLRVALGASRRGVLTMIAREALTLLAAGVVAGVLLVVAAGRAIATMLYGLKPTSFVVLAAAVAGMTIIAISASLAPARRALAVQPMEVLREE